MKHQKLTHEEPNVDSFLHEKPVSTPNQAVAWTLSTKSDDIEMSQVDSKSRKNELQ